MKKLLMVLIIASASISSAMACSCDFNFNEKDTEQAVRNFMISKLNVEDNQILAIETTNRRGYLTLAEKALLKILAGIESESAISCERGCLTHRKEKANHVVTFFSGSKTCSVKLKSNLKSDIFTFSGFKSIVKQKYKAICN